MNMSQGVKDNLVAGAIIAVVAFVARVIWKQQSSGQVINQPDTTGDSYVAPTVSTASPNWSAYTFNQPDIPPLTSSLNLNPATGAGSTPDYTIDILIPSITMPTFGTCSVCG